MIFGNQLPAVMASSNRAWSMEKPMLNQGGFPSVFHEFSDGSWAKQENIHLVVLKVFPARAKLKTKSYFTRWSLSHPFTYFLVFWPSRCFSTKGIPYCRWLKSCTTKDDDFPIICRVLTFEVVQDFFHQQYYPSKAGRLLAGLWQLSSWRSNSFMWGGVRNKTHG